MYRPSPSSGPITWKRRWIRRQKSIINLRGTNTSGSHKLNSAVAQAYYAKKQGSRGLPPKPAQASGARHSARPARISAFPSRSMVKVSYEQKPFRKAVMQVFDGEVIPP